jgi:hypothetical protein
MLCERIFLADDDPDRALIDERRDLHQHALVVRLCPECRARTQVQLATAFCPDTGHSPTGFDGCSQVKSTISSPSRRGEPDFTSGRTIPAAA